MTARKNYVSGHRNGRHGTPASLIAAVMGTLAAALVAAFFCTYFPSITKMANESREKEAMRYMKSAGQALADAFNSGGESLPDLFGPSAGIVTKDAVDVFAVDFRRNGGKVEHVYADYSSAGVSYARKYLICGTVARCRTKYVLTTDRDIYTAWAEFEAPLDAAQPAVTFTKLRIITGKTKTYIEKEKIDASLIFDDSAVFEYVNNYDSLSDGECRYIYGDILNWDASSRKVDTSTVRNKEWDGRNIDDFIAAYGTPGAYHIQENGKSVTYYDADVSGMYLVLTADSNGDILNIYLADNADADVWTFA